MPVAQTRLEILQITKLLQCVRNQDKAQIEKLCTNGIPHLVNYSEPQNGETGLHLAAQTNDEEMVKFLLELGAHPNGIDLKGRTAAMRAAEFGHVQSLELLGSAGSDMTVKDVDGKGILFYCILPTSRHTRCTEIVLENNAEVNNLANDGMPLLVLACFEANENEKVCQMLLDHGADPNSAQPSSGQTCLSAACSSGSVTIVRKLLSKGAHVNAGDKNHLSPAHRASMRGHFDVLKILASFGADMGASDAILNTPMHYAAEGGFAECCRFLSQRGCKANVKNEDGLLPRVVAKNNGFKDVVKECKKAEKLAKKVQNGGKAPTELWAVRLYDWCLENDKKLTERFETLDPDGNDVISRDEFYDVLMTLDAPIDEEDFKNLFQLHDKSRENVINYGDFIAAKKYVHKTYLMSSYEKKDKKGKKGKKGKKKKGKTKIPMPICLGPIGERTQYGGPPKIFIERHVPFTDTGRFDRDRPPKHPIQDDSAWYLHHQEVTYVNVNDAARMTDIDSLRHSYHQGRGLEIRDKYFKTPLMVASAQGNGEVVKFLLMNGADIDACDNFYWTPLHHACLSGQLDIVQMILQRGGDINAQSLNGGTPLMRAIQTSSTDIVQYLIDKGCDCTLENKKGDTALEVAKWWADPRVIQIVQAKFDTLPPQKDKGKKKDKKSAKRKSPQRAQSVPPIPQGGMTTQPISGMDESPTTSPRERKGSVLRAASAMAAGIEKVEDITYIPLKAWSRLPSTQDLIVKKEQRRQRFGDGIDFQDFKMPFKDHFMKRSEDLGGVESDED